jgi:hypothetical protein
MFYSGSGGSPHHGLLQSPCMADMLWVFFQLSALEQKTCMYKYLGPDNLGPRTHGVWLGSEGPNPITSPAACYTPPASPSSPYLEQPPDPLLSNSSVTKLHTCTLYVLQQQQQQQQQCIRTCLSVLLRDAFRPVGMSCLLGVLLQ